MRRLLTREDFDDALASGSAIVVSDSATGNRIHRPPCPWVKASYFEAKVVIGRGKNGAYYAFLSVEEAVAAYGDVRCPRCAASGASGGRARSSREGGRSSLPTGSGRDADGRKYVVRRARENAGIVEAWSRERLNYLPSDWREEFRVELRDALRELPGSDSEMLLAAFTSPETGTFDVENILFFNLEREWNTGADCVESCASLAVIFERSFAMPVPAAEGVTFRHHHRYELVEPVNSPRLWKGGRPLARWKDVRSGPPSSWERGAHVWRWMRRAELEFTGKPGPCPETFGVRLTFSGPPVALNLLRAVKASLDGIILSFQMDNGRSERSGIEKHAVHAGLSVDEAARLLLDGSRAVLGSDRLLLKNGQMNPCDHRCVAVELRRGAPSSEWLLSGELYEAHKRHD